MMQAHTKAGVLDGIAADDLEYPKPAPVEAVRLGMYALVRLERLRRARVGAARYVGPADQPLVAGGLCASAASTIRVRGAAAVLAAARRRRRSLARLPRAASA